ncbi:DUF6153 family protein [Streptomyces mayteni]
MASKHSSATPPTRASAGWVLLVLGVLVGLVAMHGLSPGTATPIAAPDSGQMAASAMGAQGGEHAHAGMNGHAEHADATCAAGGVSGGQPLAVPPWTPLPLDVASPSAPRPPGTQPTGGRAPPSLSELQLLRI